MYTYMQWGWATSSSNISYGPPPKWVDAKVDLSLHWLPTLYGLFCQAGTPLSNYNKKVTCCHDFIKQKVFKSDFCKTVIFNVYALS